MVQQKNLGIGQMYQLLFFSDQFSKQNKKCSTEMSTSGVLCVCVYIQGWEQGVCWQSSSSSIDSHVSDQFLSSMTTVNIYH